MEITQPTLTFFLALASAIGVMFSIYNSWRNPQIKTDLTTAGLHNEIANLKDEVKEIKETHLRTLESEIKNLNGNVNKLEITVAKLTTIIDERIPRSDPNLTPRGH